MLTEEQRQLLLQEPEQNVSLLYMAEEYPLLEVMEQAGMLMCRFQSDEEWCHFSHNADAGFIADFFSKHPKRQFIAVSDSHLFDWISKTYGVAWSISCYRLFLNVPVLPEPAADIDQLRPGDLRYVYDNSKYQQFLNMDYLAKRLELGGGCCIRDQQSPVAWIMTHDDGSVGMLHVLDAYRGRGFARKLVSAMSRKVHQKGRLVFAHIEPSNIASLKLFGSMGFIVRNRLAWARVSKP
jgi:8-oxo-dGTP diphosphatase